MTEHPKPHSGLCDPEQIAKAFRNAGFTTIEGVVGDEPPDRADIRTEHGHVVVNLDANGIGIEWTDLGGDFTFLFPEMKRSHKFTDGIVVHDWEQATDSLSRLKRFLAEGE